MLEGMPSGQGAVAVDAVSHAWLISTQSSPGGCTLATKVPLMARLCWGRCFVGRREGGWKQEQEPSPAQPSSDPAGRGPKCNTPTASCAAPPQHRADAPPPPPPTHPLAPRSVLFARFEGVTYLLCGLGDGHLLTWRVEGEGLAERKKLALGTKPVTLRTFK
jgi:hypothetical protein